MPIPALSVDVSFVTSLTISEILSSLSYIYICAHKVKKIDLRRPGFWPTQESVSDMDPELMALENGEVG